MATVDSDTDLIEASRVKAGSFVQLPTELVGPLTYAVLDTDGTIHADTTLGAITINLPPIASSIGRVIKIKHATAPASANALTVDGNASETIDGGLTAAIPAQNAIELHGGSTEWKVF